MDVNKEVDRLEKAVARNDLDAVVEIDTNLAVYERLLSEGLYTMPKEHFETMGFYFRDWIMNMFDEIIFIAMIVVAFKMQHELLAIILGGLGIFLLVSTFLSRRQYTKFFAGDLWRMRNEKIMANNYKLQLNYIRKTRMEHADFIEKALKEKVGNDPIDAMINRILNIRSVPEGNDDYDNEKT